VDIEKLDGTTCAAVLEALRKWKALQGKKADKAIGPTVSRIYATLGLPAPRVHRFQSPLAAMLAVPHLAFAYGIPNAHYLLENIRDPLTSQVGLQKHDTTLWRDFGQQIRGSFEMPVESMLDGKFVDHFTDRLCGELRAVSDERLVQARLDAGLFNPIWKPVMAWWKAVAPTRTWWWPFTKFIVVSDLPESWSKDGDVRIHREDGPAIEFGDGCKVWAVQGVTVTERILLHPETLTAEEIHSEKNVEVRRIMIEKLGPGTYLQKAGAKLVDMDSLTLTGSAPRALMTDSFGEKWLVGTDGSTARVYTMAVPKGAKTCSEAHQMIAGFEESRLIVEA
jgi:hypothetical protein